MSEERLPNLQSPRWHWNYGLRIYRQIIPTYEVMFRDVQRIFGLTFFDSNRVIRQAVRDEERGCP